MLAMKVLLAGVSVLFSFCSAASSYSVIGYDSDVPCCEDFGGLNLGYESTPEERLLGTTEPKAEAVPASRVLNYFAEGLVSPRDSSPEVDSSPVSEITDESQTCLQAVAKVEVRVEQLLDMLGKQQDKIAELESVNQKLADQVDRIEQQTKTNNVILYNVPESKHESSRKTLQKVLHLFKHVMKVRVNADDIAVALRSDNTTNTEARPIVVRFVNFATKLRVLYARNKPTPSKVDVAGDYSERVARVRALLQPYLVAARGQRRNAFMLYDRLVVDGVEKSLADLQTEQATEPPMEEEQDPEEVEILPPQVPPRENDYEYEDVNY